METRKQVSRLLGLEFDEVSSVDRPANQLGLVAITKRDEGPMGKLFTAEGREVDEADLQIGDVVYDEDGVELQLLSEDQVAELEDAIESGELEVPDDASELEGQLELESVGKSASGADKAWGFLGGAHKTGEHIKRHGGKYATGSASAAAAEGYRRGRNGVKKSLGDQVLSELSKAYTDGDRDLVISKALQEVSKAEEIALEAISKAEQLEYEAEQREFVELAKNYELPVDADDLGEILHVISKSGLREDQLDLLDRILHAAAAGVAYDEVGADGIAPSGVMGVIEGYANELVGKSDLTHAQAQVALLEANPAAYDEYLSELA